jgi:hypothetical protein
MGRTGKGGFRQAKQKPSPGAFIRKAAVIGRAAITVEFKTTPSLPVWLDREEHPRAGLERYLGVKHGQA